MGASRKDRELYWRGVLERQAESGLSAAAFCRQESISAPSFYSWRRTLREREAEAASGSLPEREAANFVPVRIAAGSSSQSVRILLPQGASIEASSGVDRGALVELLTALREAQLC
jgi:transposase-like protein